MMNIRRTRDRVLARREPAGTSVTLLWRESTQDVWIEVREHAQEDALVVTVAPEQALDTFHHPYAYASRTVSPPELLAA